MNINPKKDRDTHPRDSNKTKTALFTLTVLLAILTLISFFASKQVVIVKLGLAALIIASGVFLLYATYTIIKHQYALMTSIGLLLIVLGILPIAVGLDALPGYYTLKLPVLIYQAILFGSSAFLFYSLMHVPKVQPAFTDFGERQEKERKIWKVEEKKPSPFKTKPKEDEKGNSYDALRSFKPASGNKELKDLKDDSKHIQILK